MAKELTNEQKTARRKKELAILKAQNEMLEDAMQFVLDSTKYDDIEKEEITQSILKAQEENLQKGKSLYGASEDEINKSVYGKPSEYYIEKYEKRIENKGLTDEQLHTKDITEANPNIVTVSYDKESVDETDNETNIDMEPIGYIGNLKWKRHEYNKNISAQSNEDIINLPYDDKSNVNGNIAQETKNIEYIEDDNFDISNIPDYIQYDVLPLPSDGQCYKSKKSRVPVGYLTASDENLITSPNLYRDGKILDLLLKRKVLDKTINVDELCKGDRDAIILWLRATGYGIDFPIKVHDPELNIEYETTIQLDKIKTKQFTLVGDENGWFDYKTKNGDNLKFKYLNRLEEIELQKSARIDAYSQRKQKIANISKDLQSEVRDDVFLTASEKNKIISTAKLIKTWSDKMKGDENYKGYSKQMTASMIMSTMSINGNTDRKYIQNYIENMRAREAYDYRAYISEHEPGMNFNITINRPESLGGGSFDTFLEFDSFIFLSIS